MNQKLQYVNEYFGIDKSKFKETGAFNAIIGVDSLFFVDPLLLSKSKIPEFKNALQYVRNYFSQIIILLSTGNKKARKQAYDKLRAKEIHGIGIGYGNKSDDGSAIGPILASRLGETAKDIIDMGITDPAIFEIMGLFEEDFGSDRLSDLIINILIHKIYTYSERITKELQIKKTFIEKTYEKDYVFAKHPLKDGPIIFIPEDILRDLPFANSFDEISMVAQFNKDLRERFNSILSGCFKNKIENKELKKSDIKDYLFKDQGYEKVKTLIDAYKVCDPKVYDFSKDLEGRYLWLDKARKLVENNPLYIMSFVQEEDLDDVVQKIINAFKKFIETKGGWHSLYSDDKVKKPLNESHARNFFYATALAYCENSNIDISPESNAGQGPVDFKISRGKDKIVVEIKLTSGNVKQGYEKQTRIYEESEDARSSYFVVLQITEKSQALEDILEKEKKEEDQKKKHPKIVAIDARKKSSASKA